MNTPKHTPGPWIVEDYFVFASNTLRIADCDCDEQDMPESEIEANTRLIAAAPAMYEALKQTCNVMENILTDSQLDTRTLCGLTIREWSTKVRAALAQAEGRG